MIILKVILGVISFCIKAVYHVLKFLRVRILTLYLVICGLIQLIFRVFDGRGYVFWIGFCVCILITILSWVLFLRKKFATKRDRREKRPLKEEPPQEETKEEKRGKRVRKARRNQQPKYYDVEGREGYVFAEYSDRYELYFRGEGGYMLVRTDYKKSE